MNRREDTGSIRMEDDRNDRGTGQGLVLEEVLPENVWRLLILASALAVLLFSVYCLSHGITIIFMHLYYFPIVLLAYRYRYRGFVLATLLALAYVGLVVFFHPEQAEVTGAFYRFAVFIGIAAVVAYLSERLAAAQMSQKEGLGTIRNLQQFQESVITNANVWITVLAPDGTILVWNDAAEAISGYKRGDVLGMKTVWKNLYPDKVYRQKVTREIQRVIGRDTFLRNFETEIRCADGTQKTIVWNTRGIGDPTGTILSYIAIGQDITEFGHAKVALRESEDRYQNLYESSPDAIMTLEPPSWSFTSGNPATVQMFMAKDEAEFTSKEPWVHSPERQPDGRGSGEKAKEMIETALRDGTHFFEWTHKRLNGQDFPATVLLSKVELGGKVFLQATVRDITERKREEEALILSEQKFHSYVDNSPVAIFVADGAGHYLDVNCASCNLLGYSREEMLSMNVLDLAPPEERQQTLDQFISIKEKLKTESSASFEMRLKKKDGSACLVILSVVKLPSDAIMGFAVDITERKRTEGLLRESEERFRTMMNWTYDWEYWIAPDRDVVYCSPSIEHITGYSAEEFIADKGLIDRIIHPDDHPLWEEHVPLHTSNQEERKPSEVDFRIIARDGSLRWISHTCRAIFADDGRWIGRRISNRDITERKRMELELASAHKSLKDAHRLAHIGTWNWVMENDTVTWSEELYNIAGKDPSLPAPTYAEMPRIYTPGSWDLLNAAVTNALNTGKPYNLELELIRADGSIRWIIAFGGVKRDDTGKVIGLHGTLQDITERKQAEEKLKFSNVLLSTEQEVSIDGILVVNESGKIVSFNRRFIEIWGIPPDVVASRSDERALQSVMDKLADPEEFLARVKSLYANRDEKSREEILLKDGRVLDRYSAPMSGSDGKYYGRVWNFRDITERKRTEESLRESELRFRSLFERAGEGILVADIGTHKFLHANPALCTMVGYSDQEITTMGIEDIHPKEALDYVMGKFMAQARGEKIMAENIPVLRKDKTVFYADIITTIILIDGRMCNVGFFADITERKNVQDKLKKFNEELEKQVKSRTSELNTSLKEKEVLLKEIHHRVRNNLQVVSSIISLQAKSVSDPGSVRQIQEIRMRIGTLALVHEIAYLAKTPDSINMRDFLSRCTSKVIDEFGCEPGRVTITITAENVQVALSQAVPCSLIVNELLMNSIRHAFPGKRHGEITIGFSITKGNYVLEYGDDGIGLPEGVHPDKAETGGLALIQGLARQIRGTVRSTTRPGTGCTLTFPAETGGT